MLRLNGKPYVYADDSAIVYETYDALEMQADVNELADFYRINVLSLNVKKTKFMVFKSQYNKENLTLPTLHLNQTEILQTSEIRYLFPTKTLYENLEPKILSIENLYKTFLVTFVHQCVNKQIHNTTTYKYTNNRMTRQATNNLIEIPRVRTTRYGKNGIQYRSINSYNMIPPKIRMIYNINTFKREIKPILRNL